MRSRAVWRSRPNDPRTGLGWLAQDLGGPSRLILDGVAWTMKVAALALVLQGRWLGALILFALACPVSDPETPRRAFPFVRRFLPVGPLLTLPSPATPFPCRVEVLKGGTLLGRDVGVVTFLDGWLHYEGYRTEFSLRRCDVIRRMENRLDLAEGGEVAFAPQDVLVAGDHTETNLSARFRANLLSWMRSDSPDGESILPAAVLHPSGLVRARANLFAVTIVGALLAALAATYGSSLFVAVALLAFGQGLFPASRDLRRVGRLARPASARAVE